MWAPPTWTGAPCGMVSGRRECDESPALPMPPLDPFPSVDAGIFNYGFIANTTSVPFAFYMEVVPWVASWAWQPFYGWREEVPAPDVWAIPEACSTAQVCPGWAPTSNAPAAAAALAKGALASAPELPL